MSLEDNGAAPAAADTTPVAESAPAAPASEPTIDDTLSRVWDEAQKPSQERDEGGRFKAKDAPLEAALATKTPEAKPAKAVETPRPEGTATDDKPPLAWPKDKAEAWSLLSPETRTWIREQEAAANKGFQKQAEKYKPYDELDRVFEPWKQRWQLEGATPAQRVQQLLAAQAALERDAPSAIQWLADQYRVDLRQFAASQGQDQHVDPRHRALEAKIAEMEAREHQREQERQQQELTVQYNSVTSELAAFAKDPAHGHFEEVRQEMAEYIRAGLSLEKAYETAVWSNPTLRAKAIEAQRASEAEKVQETAAKARAANVVNVRSTPAGANTPKTMDETLRATADRLFARA